MEIINDKVLMLRTRQPDKITRLIPKSKVISQEDDVYRVAVNWGLEETQVLAKLKVKNVPATIKRDYQWTGKLKPFTHQKETAAFLTLNRKAFCFNEQGTGKTASVIWAADYLMKAKKIKRVLVICPLSIMKAAWQQDLFKFAMHRSVGIAHGTARTRANVISSNVEFVIINFDGVAVVKDAILNGGFDLIVADECFVAGTPVLTPTGYQPIETLKSGDAVLTSIGAARIKRLICNTSQQLVEVKTNDGQTIKCTPDHPFFTDAGWVTARNLTGRRLVHNTELSTMRNPVCNSHPSLEMAQDQGYADWDDLLTVLRSEEVPRVEPRCKLFLSDAQGTARQLAGVGAQSGVSAKYVEVAETNRAQTNSAWGQWHWDDCGREISSESSTEMLGMELPSSVGEEAARLSYQLQVRLRQREHESRFRNRREQPQHDQPQTSRQEKRSQTVGTWVDSVTYIKCASGEPVYNLEVEGTPNYFIGSGLLVHNCSAYKNVNTRRWKVLRDIAVKSSWLWMLTGTPAAQSPLDAYGLAKLINPENTPKYYGSYRDIVMYKVSQFRWVPKPKSQQVVHELLQPAIRFERKQCLDLPEVTFIDREAPLTAQQKAIYKKLKQDMYVEAAGEDISAVNAAVRINKLLQVSGGSVYTDTGEVVDLDVSNRLSVVLEVIEEASHKVLVFVPFTHTIDLLKAYLDKNNITCDVINGKVPVNKRSDIVKRFQEQPDPQVLIIQPQAASHGLTLTAANTIIWYAPVTSVETYLQANARINRPGQKNAMCIVHIRGSEVETRLYNMLQNNITNHTKIIDLYRQEILENS